jgi:hypothetical protein
VAFGLVYLMLARVLSWLALLARSDVAKDARTAAAPSSGAARSGSAWDLPCVD